MGCRVLCYVGFQCFWLRVCGFGLCSGGRRPFPMGLWFARVRVSVWFGLASLWGCSTAQRCAGVRLVVVVLIRCGRGAFAWDAFVGWPTRACASRPCPLAALGLIAFCPFLFFLPPPPRRTRRPRLPEPREEASEPRTGPALLARPCAISLNGVQKLANKLWIGFGSLA